MIIEDDSDADSVVETCKIKYSKTITKGKGKKQHSEDEEEWNE